MHLKSEVLQARDENVPLVGEMKRLMREDLDSRYSEKAERVMDLACFIDPRFKGGFSEDLDNTINICVQEALRLVQTLRLTLPYIASNILP